MRAHSVETHVDGAFLAPAKAIDCGLHVVVNVAGWCSDIFEIPFWNAEVVRVAFSLDCCDREVIGHIGTTGGISGEMIRDLMVDSVERRLGNLERLLRSIQRL
jgi:transposase InsO family protein